MVMDTLSPELKQALESFEMEELDIMIERKRLRDFKQLRRLLALDASVKPEYRQRALYALGRWGDPSIVKDIVTLLPELPESHCITGLEALSRLGTTAARKTVRLFADNPSPHIRKTVVEALTRLGGRSEIARLQMIAKTDKVQWVRELAQKRLKTALQR